MTDLADKPDEQSQRNARSPGVWKIAQSILAGALGVQTDKRRREDFSSHSPWPYILAGVLFTAGFVVGLVLVVQLVLASR